MISYQISDTHIDEPGTLVYGRFDTTSALERAVATIAAMDQRPDLILHTGDIASHGSAPRYRRFREIMSKLDVPLAVIPGNHDERESLRDAFADSPYMPANGEFLHHVVEEFDVRIICCDSVIAGEVAGEMCPTRLAWLGSRLAEAPQRPTVVALHHPPFYSGMTGTSAKGLVQGGEALASLMRDNPQVVAILAGHVHRPITTRFGGTVAFTGPTTCYPFGLDTGPQQVLNVTHEPPAIAVHLWLHDAVPSGAGLVSHVLPLGEWAPPVTLLKEGKRVLAD